MVALTAGARQKEHGKMVRAPASRRAPAGATHRMPAAQADAARPASEPPSFWTPVIQPFLRCALEQVSLRADAKPFKSCLTSSWVHGGQSHWLAFFLFNFPSLGGSILKKYFYSLMYLAALGHSCSTQGLPPSLWGTWDLVLGLESNLGPCVRAGSLSHQTTRTDLLLSKDAFL